MSSYRIIILLIASSVLIPQTQYRRDAIFDGWGIYANEIPPDSISNTAYRIESYYRDGLLGFIRFFSSDGKYQKGQEYFYNQENILLRIIYYSADNRVKWTYHFRFDPLVGDWKVEKRSNRGEYIDELYLQEIEYDTAFIDPGFFHGLPGLVPSY